MARSRRSTTAGQHSFARVPSTTIPRSVFNRSFGHKTNFYGGLLYPIFVDEALPGDTFNLRMSAFARLATPLHPFMDNLYLDVQFFAVPYRLVWDNFQKFMGEQTDPEDSTDYLVPEVDGEGVGAVRESIYDYMGIPPALQENHSALPLRAYNLIWNEWYRDQNLQDSVPVNTADGPDNKLSYTLLRRGKRHDYFTSCLPWPAKGPAVSLGLGDQAPLVGIVPTTAAGGGIPQFKFPSDTGPHGLTGKPGIDEADWSSIPSVGSQETASWHTTGLESDVSVGGAYADLTEATAATINQIREASQIQRLYERDARGGTRYTEILRSHFRVISPDQRLQRPEYLGGGSFPVNVNPVPQTGETGVTTPQGNLAAFGVASSTRNGFSKSFVEHCVILGLISARADLTYQQGLERQWSRRTRWDFYWPDLAHLGEQAVLTKEIYAGEGIPPATLDTVFGYQERFAEYRYKPSLTTAQMRSTHVAPLDTWHLAQEFSGAPTLSATFIEDNPPIDRVIAVPSEPHFLLDTFFQYKCVRPMPTYSVPGIARF